MLHLQIMKIFMQVLEDSAQTKKWDIAFLQNKTMKKLIVCSSELLPCLVRNMVWC